MGNKNICYIYKKIDLENSAVFQLKEKKSLVLNNFYHCPLVFPNSRLGKTQTYHWFVSNSVYFVIFMRLDCIGSY